METRVTPSTYKGSDRRARRDRAYAFRGRRAAVDATMLIVTVVFWIIIASIIGGVVLLRPVSKRLGNFLDEWIATLTRTF